MPLNPIWPGHPGGVDLVVASARPLGSKHPEPGGLQKLRSMIC